MRMVEAGPAAPRRHLVSRLLARLTRSRGAVETVVRYVGVGGLSSLIYAVAVAAGVSGLGVHHDLATLLGYAAATPVNFVLHRGFTFRSLGLVRADLTRYLVAQGVSILVSFGVMALCVDVIGWPYAAGIIGAIVLVPLVNFVVMDRWVFARTSR